MPRSFDLSADYDGSVDDVHRAFTDADYWRARLDESGVDVATLESMRVGGETGDEDTVEVVTLQVIRSDKLPGMVTQLHSGDLCIRREETWGPVTDGAATGSVAGSIVDAPVNLAGTAVLEPFEGGTRLTFRATVQVRVPIIGGKLENIIGTRLAELVAAEQRFTTEWLAKRG
ncbi:DUF2505 domain-containing protein [Mycobacterium colombiense]|uniref:DUF2505 domain-containing protein n=1 Tax=Mycobacterium colombiense TaxID=339268 RepID=A0A1A2YYZ0_9MYCO|nr:DUF2505 domain-containing protein [Mycobacterium colombiense]OBI43240.1 hypothetical protein A5708_19060 [Mycobacterium colombiense]